jgi:hypothetical protein
MEALRALDPAEGMIEHFGDRAATEALVLASNAAMLGDLSGTIMWLNAVQQIRALLAKKSA